MSNSETIRLNLNEFKQQIAKELFQPEEELDNNYTKYRGKCKEMSEELVKENSNLRLVRGHYHCPVWGEQEHWWTVDINDGTIHDPTKLQFPSKGCGEYIEFNGFCTCTVCGKKTKEEDTIFYSNYTYCSDECVLKDIL